MLHCNHTSAYYNSMQVSMCISGVHYVHIRSSCLSQISSPGSIKPKSTSLCSRKMISAWFIRLHAVYFSFTTVGKRSSCWETAPAIFVVGKSSDRPHHILVLSIKSQRDLESVVHITVRAAQCQLNERKAKSERERGARSAVRYQSKSL